MATKGLNYVISLVDHVSKPMRGIVKTVDTLNRGILSVAGVGTALAGATGAITAFVDRNLDELDKIHQLRNVTGEAVEYIYELGKVAEVNGSSSQAAQRSIEGLSKVIGEAATGAGRGAKAFKLYGLSARDGTGAVKTASSVMDEITAKMQGMNEAEQIAMLSKLGIDASMIQTLRLTNKEMESARRHARALSLGVATSEAAQSAADFKDAMTRLGQASKGVREYIAVRLSPTIRHMIEYFEQWFVANNALIKNGLNRAVHYLSRFLKGTVAFFGALDRVIKATIGWEKALYGLIGALALVKAATVKAFVFNPVTWITAAVIGLILVIDDLLVFLRGGNSYLGAFWQKMRDMFNHNRAEAVAFAGVLIGLGAPLLNIRSKFFTVAAGAKKLFRMLGTLVRIFKLAGVALRLAFVANPVGLIISAVTGLGYAIYRLIDKYGSLKAAASAVLNWIGEKWAWLTAEFLALEWVQKIRTAFDGIKQTFSGVLNGLLDGAKRFANQIIKLLNGLGADIKPFELSGTIGTIDAKTGAVGAAVAGAEIMPPATPIETASPVKQLSAVKPVETPSPIKQLSAVKPVETPSPVKHLSAVKPVEMPTPVKRMPAVKPLIPSARFIEPAGLKAVNYIDKRAVNDAPKTGRDKDFSLNLNPNQKFLSGGKSVTNAYRQTQTINQNITIHTRGEFDERKLAEALKREQFKNREKYALGMT